MTKKRRSRKISKGADRFSEASSQEIVHKQRGGIWSLQEQKELNEIGVWPDNSIIEKNGLSFFIDAKASNSYAGTGNVWKDLSDNGNDFSWNSTPTYVSGSHPYFVSDQLAYGPASNSVGIDNSTGYTIQILTNDRSNFQSSAFKFYQNNASSSAGRGIFAHLTWSNDTVYFDQGGCCNSDQRVNVGSGGSNSWNLWTFRRNSSSRDIWKNGTRLATNTTASATIGLDSRSITLFGDDTYGTAWNAWVSSFIAYSRGISDAEIISNYNSIAAYYNL